MPQIFCNIQMHTQLWWVGQQAVAALKPSVPVVDLTDDGDHERASKRQKV